MPFKDVGSDKQPLFIKMPTGEWREYAGGSGTPLYVKQQDGSWKVVTRQGRPTSSVPYVWLMKDAVLANYPGVSSTTHLDSYSDFDGTVIDSDYTGYFRAVSIKWWAGVWSPSESAYVDQVVQQRENSVATFTFNSAFLSAIHKPSYSGQARLEFTFFSVTNALYEVTLHTGVPVSPGTIPTTQTTWVSSPFTITNSPLTFTLDPIEVGAPDFGNVNSSTFGTTDIKLVFLD